MDDEMKRNLNNLYWALLFPLSMVILAIIPGINRYFFSWHVGIGWAILWLSFPWYISWIISYLLSAEKWKKTRCLRFAVVAIVAYITFSYPVSLLVEILLQKSLGFPIDSRAFWNHLTFPFSLLIK